MSTTFWYEEQSILLADDRRLSVAQCGTRGGTPVIYLHGTPGSRLNRYPFDDDLLELGVRLITYDRPGYGGSTRDFGRCVADAAKDVRAIIEDFELSRVPVFGHSGGGPHALACAARLGDLISRAASVAGIAPYDSSDEDWALGFPESTQSEFRAALTGPETLEDYLVKTNEFLDEGDAAPDLVMPGVPDVDGRFLSDPSVKDVMSNAMKLAIEPGLGGWIDDDIEFVTGWGFELTDIHVPCSLWHGVLDSLVPARHATLLASQMPRAELHLKEGEGHSSMQRMHPEIVRWLIAD